MSHESPKNPEMLFLERLEAAKDAQEIARIVDSIMMSEAYMLRGEGGERISLANRKGIERFGRQAYREAFDDILGSGMANMYIKPHDEDPC